MERSEERMLEEYTQRMGPELGPLFHALSSELSWIHWRWKQYRILFGEKPSRIDLLNASAPLFFQIIHNVLFEDTLLGISRLVSPPKSAGKQNLTILRLPTAIKETGLRSEIIGLIEKAKSAAAFAIDWRHRHIAHRDLNLALRTNTKLLEEATREKVEGALSALRDVLNHIELAQCGASTLYGGPSPWDAESLLYVIRDGLLREKDRQARWNKGEPHEDDLTPREEI